MSGARQITRGGQNRENAILQGLLAAGWPLDQAQGIAAREAGPNEADEHLGEWLMLLWLGPSMAVIAFMFIAITYAEIFR